MRVTPWVSWRVEAAVRASVGDAESSLTRIRWEEGDLGRVVRAVLEAEEGSRTAAITVVVGRVRKVFVREKPRPREAPVIR